ncbi:MAG: RNA polymerase sigma factor [Lysobacterales bacterium]|jgi:RNA polymerase sigma-70 factor (ECF subfamily)
MRAVSDEQLIEWVANGDPSCLGTLFERHHQGVYQFSLRMTRNPAFAEDITQDVFMRVLKKAGSFRHEGTFRGWLFNIARTITLDYLRRQKREGAPVPMDDYTESQLVDSRSAEQAAASLEQVSALERALATLPLHYQEVILLGRFEFKSFKQLAQALGCKTGTARVRMHRAMQQLNVAFAELNGVIQDA